MFFRIIVSTHVHHCMTSPMYNWLLNDDGTAANRGIGCGMTITTCPLNQEPILRRYHSMYTLASCAIKKLRDHLVTARLCVLPVGPCPPAKDARPWFSMMVAENTVLH